MRWRRRRRVQARRLTLAEANLRAQCAALEAEVGTSADDADTPAVIDVAAVERERLFADHPQREQRRPTRR